MCEGFLANAYKLGLCGACNGPNRDSGAGKWHDWICLYEDDHSDNVGRLLTRVGRVLC